MKVKASQNPSRRLGLLFLTVLLIATLAAAIAACSSGNSSTAYKSDQLILATTTSLKDSGLLDDVVLPAFKQAYPGITVKTLAVGSGEAIQFGMDGEADVLLVHSPKDEATFMEEGYGTVRLPVAYNYFVIVGPAKNPARVENEQTAAEAFAAIAKGTSTFVSRGDDSGTNKKELAIWEAAGVTPKGGWYISTGQGMGETLQVASERQGYTLTDLSTFLSMKDTLDLKVLTKQSGDLKNVYSVIVCNQLKHDKVNAAAAEMFAQLLVTLDIQKAIGEYGKDKVGQALFFPNSGALGGEGY